MHFDVPTCQHSPGRTAMILLITAPVFFSTMTLWLSFEGDVWDMLVMLIKTLGHMYLSTIEHSEDLSGNIDL